MTLPHHEGFPYRHTGLIWVSALCVLLGTAWPGQAPGARLADVGLALLSFAACYGFTRLILGGLARFMQDHFDGLPLWCLLLVFYGGILATLSGLLTAPFQWHDVHQGGTASPTILAALPSGLFTAAGALNVVQSYYWQT